MLFDKKPDEALAGDYAVGRLPPAPASNGAGPKPHKPVNAPVRSVVDGWLRITGDLEGDGEIEIDGQVVGNVRCKHLVVGSKAMLEGNISAEQVVIRGNVKGVIRANYVMLQHTARVESEIIHKELAIETGARFEGASRHREDPIGERKPMATETKAAMQATEAPCGVACEAAVADTEAEAAQRDAVMPEQASASARPKIGRTTRQVAAELERLRATTR